MLTTLMAWMAAIFSFLSDAVSAVIGVATIYAFFRYRKRISAALKLLRLHHMNERRDEIKKTLELISSLTFDKTNAREIRSLFGRLNGQLVPLCDVIPELIQVQATIEDIALRNGKLTEPVKQSLIHTIYAHFESARYKSLGEAVGGNE